MNDSLSRNLQHGWRRLQSAPVFAAFSVITLALGIGATTAVYSLIHVMTGPPPGIAGVERVVEVYHYPTGSRPMVNLAWEDYQDLRARQSVFESVTGWAWFRASILANGQTETSTAEIVDGDISGRSACACRSAGRCSRKTTVPMRPPWS